MDSIVEGHFVPRGLVDIAPAQAEVLRVPFEARQPRTARPLAVALSLSEVTVGRVLCALEWRGGVARERDPSDSGAIRASSTLKGRESVARFLHVTNTLMDQALAGLPPSRPRGVRTGSATSTASSRST